MSLSRGFCWRGSVLLSEVFDGRDPSFGNFTRSALPPSLPPLVAASALEKLAFVYSGLPEVVVRFLNLLNANNLSVTPDAAGIPVTTGLLVLLSAAAKGSSPATIAQAIDGSKWDDEVKLARMITATLTKVKDKAEVLHMTSSEYPEEMAACLRRALKGPCISMRPLDDGPLEGSSPSARSPFQRPV